MEAWRCVNARARACCFSAKGTCAFKASLQRTFSTQMQPWFKDASTETVQGNLSTQEHGGGWKDGHEDVSEDFNQEKKSIQDGSGPKYEKKFVLSKDRWPDFYLERLDMSLLGKSKFFRNPPSYAELQALRRKCGLPEWPEPEDASTENVQESQVRGGWKDGPRDASKDVGQEKKTMQDDGSHPKNEKKFVLSKDRWPDFYLERLDMDLLSKSKVFRNPPSYAELKALRRKIGLPEWPELEDASTDPIHENPSTQEHDGDECKVFAELDVQGRKHGQPKGPRFKKSSHTGKS